MIIRLMYQAFIFLMLYPGTVLAQEANIIGANSDLFLCDEGGTAIVNLPDLVLREVNIDDFSSGETTFVMTINALGVSWDMTDTSLAFNGTSQNFAAVPQVNGNDLLLTIDLAANNTTLETITLTGLQLTFDTWDFNTATTLEISIEDPASGGVYSF